jgi:4'-phosphopantetheinyl transferase
MTTWIHPSAPPPLELDEVHLWRVDLASGEDELARLQATLSPAERARADRFASSRDRRRYTVSRATLRALLAAYLDQPPVALVFGYNAHGKPELQGDGALRFNLSHSGERAVFAFARVEVGVDIERVRDDFDLAGVAERTFAPEETARMIALPDDRRLHAFFSSWTRREACLKAAGSGWSQTQASLEERHTVHPFDCEGGYLGALAVAAVPRYLRFFDA